MLGDFGSDFVERMSGVEDVIDQQNVAILDVQHHLRVDRQFAALGSLIAARLQDSNSQWHAQFANQVGAQNDAAGEDADDSQRHVTVVIIDILGELFNAVVELCFVEECFHGSFTLVFEDEIIVSHRRNSDKVENGDGGFRCSIRLIISFSFEQEETEVSELRLNHSLLPPFPPVKMLHVFSGDGSRY